MKINNINKGITLIALVITIIVMLILVAVTISMAVNGGLFDYAGKAVGETQNAINKEQELASGGLNIAGTWYNSIDEYILGDGKVILSDNYGHRYTVDEPGKYYFYSYTYGQNFMTLFDVTEEDGKLVATRVGEYSNESGKSREEAYIGDWQQGTSWNHGGTCLSDSSALVPIVSGEYLGGTVPFEGLSIMYYRISFYLVSGYYFCETTNGTFNTYYIDLDGSSESLGNVEMLSTDSNWIDLKELACYSFER